MRLAVPAGTVVRDAGTGEVLGDLDGEGARLVVARGGAGGRGNFHFKSAVNRSPQIAEPGLAGEARELVLDLKLIADVALVGPPNAGKSSLLRAISAATPKVADYPFTTLDPQLGVTDLPGGGRVVVADVPGLIAGAARGAGLGLRFLRHVERTRILVFVVDGASLDPWADLESVRREVTTYSARLARRPALVAGNKVDLPVAAARRRRSRRAGVIWCSALAGEGVAALVEAIGRGVAAAPRPGPELTAAPAIRLPRQTGPASAPVVCRRGNGFEVVSPALDRLLARTDLESPEGLRRFQVQLDRIGVAAALEAAGVEPGDTVRVGDAEFEYRP